MDVLFGPLQSVTEVVSHYWTAYLAPRARSQFEPNDKEQSSFRREWQATSFLL
jgi:hypothetical protein